jgi:flagellar biosynthetic protein FlhB
MAEEQDESSKTEDPTQKRLDDARKRGQVAQSREVNNTLILLASTLALAGFTPWIADRSRQLFIASLGEAHLVRVGLEDVQAIATDLVLAIALLSGPVVLAALVAGIAAGIAQVGFMVAPQALKPQFSKISPLKGLSRLLSLSALVEFAKGLLKMALVAWIFWVVVVPAFDSLPLMVLRDVQQSLVEVSSLTLKLLFVVVAATVVIAAADLLYQRLKLQRELRMTRTELQDEFKEQEGDPMVKAKLRQIRQERSRRRMMSAVPKADVVITNPTHYAVALKYDRDAMDAPVVVAKGTDRVALRIREIAEENKVPIVENPPLARALHASVDIDRAIDPEHYKAVAEIISYVWRLKAGARGGARPS